ncbi:MAG: glycosyltransferase family 2 protein [bacterium]|nr:glycosyltransferase family 2 protein [bacterium]
MALVSVIITTFNRPKVLREAIKSVLDQDFSDFELIVVDDFSRGEETKQVISSFSDARICYIKNKTNEGGTASLNNGLRAAKGKYIAILDDDDVWICREKLRKQVEFLDGHPDYVLVGTNSIIVEGETKKEMTRSKWPQNDLELRRNFFHENPFAHSSVMYLREVALVAGGYDKLLPRGKDYDLMLTLGTHGKMAVLSDYSLMYSEAVPSDAELIKKRLVDAQATAKVLCKHRREYPGFLGAYTRVAARVFVFRLLTVVPMLYKFYRKTKI